VKDYGIDGFRVDTVKHVEADIWQVLKKESELSLAHWKLNNPELVKDNLPFYMVGEVYNWGVNGFKDTVPDSVAYNYGDKQVDFFEFGFDALINMGFATHAHQEPEQIFSEYSTRLYTGELNGKGIVSYLGSHDDHHSFDRERQRNYEAAFKLMLAPGAVQIYYGDELARPMFASEDVLGDAHMRRFMNWKDLSKNETQQLLAHWQKLGQFRQEQDAVGSGMHQLLSAQPYIFQRILDGVSGIVAGQGLAIGKKVIDVSSTFADGTVLLDYYSGHRLKVQRGKVTVDSEFSYVLLGIKNTASAKTKIEFRKANE
jgi:alpha-amylase